jgi:hypothetical protein
VHTWLNGIGDDCIIVYAWVGDDCVIVYVWSGELLYEHMHWVASYVHAFMTDGGGFYIQLMWLWCFCCIMGDDLGRDLVPHASRWV